LEIHQNKKKLFLKILFFILAYQNYLKTQKKLFKAKKKNKTFSNFLKTFLKLKNK